MRYSDATRHEVWTLAGRVVRHVVDGSGRRPACDDRPRRPPTELDDWILRGTEGEVHPVKDIVFTRKYRERDALD